MALKALAIIEAIRVRLDDFGGSRGAPSPGYYARWQEDDGPCLWKNAELMRYLISTIKEIGVRNPINDAGTLRLSATSRFYPLDPIWLSIDSVTRTSDGQPLLKTTVSEMQHVDRWYRNGRDILRVDGEMGADWRSIVGVPTHYLLDERSGFLSTFPRIAPNQTEALQLIVARTFYADLSWAKIATGVSPSLEIGEVPDHFYDALIAGVCAKAFRVRDSDAADEQLAASAEAEFNYRIGSPKSWHRLNADARWAGSIVEFVPNTRFVN
jgi:hypothetical protein